jgi:transglutaminase-like putative cysteine protease
MNANDLDRLLQASTLLDYDCPALRALIQDRAWRSLPESERIGAVYGFVRDEIGFGYNLSDDLSASQVLADGIGQCNTKGTLLMALLRACGIPCRLHGFTIHKALQKGAITGIAYWLAPRDIVHSWVEVRFDDRWVNLEGFILDTPYLRRLQQRFASQRRSVLRVRRGDARPAESAGGLDGHRHLHPEGRHQPGLRRVRQP